MLHYINVLLTYLLTEDSINAVTNGYTFQTHEYSSIGRVLSYYDDSQTNQPTNKQTNRDKNMTFLAKLINYSFCNAIITIRDHFTILHIL